MNREEIEDLELLVLSHSIYDLTAYIEEHKSPNNNQFIQVDDAYKMIKEFAEIMCENQRVICGVENVPLATKDLPDKIELI